MVLVSTGMDLKLEQNADAADREGTTAAASPVGSTHRSRWSAAQVTLFSKGVATADATSSKRRAMLL